MEIATIAHVISVIFGMGSALVSDVLFTFYSKDKKLNKTEINTLSVLSKVVLISLFFIIASGFVIFLSDTDKYLSSAKFLSKMTIMLILLINGYILHKYVWSHLLQKDFFISKRERPIRRIAFVSGAISVASWVFVCVLGVLDDVVFSYYQIVLFYVIVVIIGALASLIIESKKY